MAKTVCACIHANIIYKNPQWLLVYFDYRRVLLSQEILLKKSAGIGWFVWEVAEAMLTYLKEKNR